MADPSYNNRYDSQGYAGYADPTVAGQQAYPNQTYPYQTNPSQQTQPTTVPPTPAAPGIQTAWPAQPTYAAGTQAPVPQASTPVPQAQAPTPDSLAQDAEAIKKADKQAESALTWGIVGLLICMLSIVIGLFVGIIAFLIDATAIDYAEKAKKAGSTSKKATVGKVLGWVSIVLGCLILAAFRASNSAG